MKDEINKIYPFIGEHIEVKNLLISTFKIIVYTNLVSGEGHVNEAQN